MNLSENHSALQKRISHYITALQNEIEALRNYSSRNYLLVAGKFLGISDTEFLYEFKLEDDARIVEDVPIEIDVGGDPAQGTVVTVEGDRIVLLLKVHIGDSVEHATLRTAPFFLLEQLIERLDSMEDKDVECIEALFRGDSDLEESESAGEESEAGLTLDPKKLNEFQIAAATAVVRKRISFIWGPPGTGKTQTLAFSAANLVTLGEKVLIISNTNIAVDLALQKTLNYLKDSDEYFAGKFVRFGVPRLAELEDFPWSLPQYVARDKHPALYATIDKIETDIRGIMARLRSTRAKRSLGSNQRRISKLREELSALREEAYGKESKIIQHANLVASTAAKAAIASQVFNRRFDAVLIDEASMLYLPYVVHAASLARKHVGIFGDFMQIPPITQSSTKVLDVLSRDIFRETNIHRYMTKPNSRMSTLEIQYRMPLQVMELVNDRIYAGKLKASANIKASEPKEDPVIFYDTSTLRSRSFREATSNSRVNILSGITAINLAIDSLKHGAKSVGIITPYRAQSRFLRAVLNSMNLDSTVISAATVHTFQGNERDVIVFDFVDDDPLPLGILLSTYMRDNDGDISEGERLLNVAMTRARKRLLFVGNFEYLSSKSADGSLLRFVLDKLKRDKSVVRLQLDDRNGVDSIGKNFPGLSVHHGYVDCTIPLLKDIQGSTEELKLIQPIKAKLQFFKYVLNKEVESSKGFGALDTGLLQQKLKSTNLITSDKSDLFFWMIDGKTLHVFDILNRLNSATSRDSSVFSLRISVPEIAKVFNYILPRKSARLTGTGGREIDAHCSVCGGKMELKEIKGMIVAQCSDNACVTVPADGKIIEAILEEKGQSCPVCAGKMRIKRSRKGYFVGCANYPSCSWTADLGDVLT